MVLTTARQIGDGEVVFVGMRLPMQAFAVAKRLHAPTAVGLFECGLVRDAPARGRVVTMADPANVEQASWAGSMVTLMGLLSQGYVHLGMLGGAQVDRYGNLNTSYIGPYSAPRVRLPGSGGASDIASLAQRTVILMPHERRRFVAEVDYLTSPGHGTGDAWREGVGLPRRHGPQTYGGPVAVITTLGVLLPNDDGELVLAHVHPGVSVEEVKAQTGWPLQISPELSETQPPGKEELAVLRSAMHAMQSTPQTL